MSILSSIQHASLPHLSWVTPPKQFAQFHACTSSALHYAQKNKLDALVVANEWLLVVKTIPGVVDATVTSPGYINIMVDPIEAVAYLKNKAKPLPKKYLLEFVSANPTGPLHLGHGRQAVIGNVLQHALVHLGHEVHCQYYFNDAGNQIVNLWSSIESSWKPSLNEVHYKGAYIQHLAQQVAPNGVPLEGWQHLAVEQLKAEQQHTLQKMGVYFDSFVSETFLHQSGQVNNVLTQWNAQQLLIEQHGAQFFHGTPSCPVALKSNGSTTYFVADVAYHAWKLQQPFDHFINIQGSDHLDTKQKVLDGLHALNVNTEHLEYIIHSMVHVVQGSELIKQSKRSGNFTSLNDMLDTVGADSLIFALAQNTNEKEIKLDVAKLMVQGIENPVFYCQMAYAKLNSLLHKKGVPPKNKMTPSYLTPLFTTWLHHQNTIDLVAQHKQPQLLTRALMDIAGVVHKSWSLIPSMDTLSYEEKEVVSFWITEVRALLYDLLKILGVQVHSEMKRLDF